MALSNISNEVFILTDGWPKAVGNKNPLLFVVSNGTIRTLPSMEHLFAWMGEGGTYSWSSGTDRNNRSLTPKQEFFEHLKEKADRYQAVAEVPHEPPLPGHFYSWTQPKGYTATGEYLAELLAMFDNADTPEDVALIKALFLTPCWGAENGTRPAFAITAPDKRCGKSTLGELVGDLYGGYILHTLSKRDDENLFSRLLGKEALTKRVVLVDNARQAVASANLEAAITLGNLSGHLIYYGESSRPNTLTYILTANGLRLSRDMAGRSYIIRLKRPTISSDVKERAKALVKANRDLILADIIAELRKPPVTTDARDPGGWQGFVTQVLSRCANDPAAVVKLTLERRAERDDDLAEAEEIMDALDTHILANAMPDTSVFIKSSDVTDILARALHRNFSNKAVSNLLSEHLEAGRLPRVTKAGEDGTPRRSQGKGYYIQRATNNPTDTLPTENTCL